MYAYGTHHAVHTEESLAEASALCVAPVALYTFLATRVSQQDDAPYKAMLN